jgi:hypothetical protein
MSRISAPESPKRGLRPRIEVAPPYVATYGDEAIELMVAAGKRLDPWQEDAVRLLLAFDADGQWVCFEYCELCSRQNGKGAILEARALAGFLLLGEEEIMWSAHQYKTAKAAFRRMRKLLRALGTAVGDNLVIVDDIHIKIINTNGFEGFERLDTEAAIRFIARSKDSGRGLSGDLNIIDEAYDYDMAEQEALGPTMLARPNPQFIYTSSPPLSGETGDILYSLRERAEAMLETGEPDALGYRDWGLGGDLDKLDEVDFDDPENYEETNPALCTGRLTIPKIKKLRKMLGTRGFARECLGLWPRRRERGGTIDKKQWASLKDVQSRRSGDVALAVDIAPNRDWAAIGLYGLRDDGLGHLQVVDFRPGTDWIVDRLVELRDALDPVGIGMGRGTAASLKTALTEVGITEPENKDEPTRGDLFVLTALEMSAACGQLIDEVRRGGVRHLGQEPLDEAAAGAKTRKTVDSIAWSRKENDETEICPLVTVTEARFVFATWEHLVKAADYDVLESIG